MFNNMLLAEIYIFSSDHTSCETETTATWKLFFSGFPAFTFKFYILYSYASVKKMRFLSYEDSKDSLPTPYPPKKTQPSKETL